jgi:3-phenylpropionate/trans-cinnamate dioxygenase ferredoxin reductase component
MSTRCAPNFSPGRRVIIVGGGYIGLEAAAVASKLGLAGHRSGNGPAHPAARGQRPRPAPMSALCTSLTASRSWKKPALTGWKATPRHRRPAEGRPRPAGRFRHRRRRHHPEHATGRGGGPRHRQRHRHRRDGPDLDPAIWAAGDCASFPWKGGRIRLESVGNAIDQAEVVAANILGAATPYEAKPWFWSDQFDLKLQIAGPEHRLRPHRHPQGRRRSRQLLVLPRRHPAGRRRDERPRAYMVGKRLIEGGKSPAPDTITAAPDLKALLKA